MARFVGLLALAIALFACRTRSMPDTLFTEFNEQEMEAAIARAKAEVDEFIVELSNPTGTHHSVKVPIRDGETVEHFWMVDVVYRDGYFEGTIDNDPGLVRNVTRGQRWRARKEEISDWMYLKDGKMYGNYTVRPLLGNLPPEEAKKLQEMFAKP
ncbi:MAG: hypothetical protein KatS3mg110_4252 [Pirellulaceae bacterium]|nr:MAG: hypothetical protein KatS3mg110_4252 [Pirellulaceae bacterium]